MEAFRDVKRRARSFFENVSLTGAGRVSPGDAERVSVGFLKLEDRRLTVFMA